MLAPSMIDNDSPARPRTSLVGQAQIDVMEATAPIALDCGHFAGYPVDRLVCDIVRHGSTCAAIRAFALGYKDAHRGSNRR
jgi:hypothetical protein